MRNGVCSKCGPIVRKDERPNAARRGYDYRWNKIAKTHKACNPLCALCEAEGWTTIATKSHHLMAVNSGGAVHVGQDALLAVCESCHKRVEGLGADWRKAIKK